MSTCIFFAWTYLAPSRAWLRAVFSDLMCLPCRTAEMHDWDGCNLTLLRPDHVLMKTRSPNSLLFPSASLDSASRISKQTSPIDLKGLRGGFSHSHYLKFSSALPLCSSLLDCVPPAPPSISVCPIFLHLPPASSHSGPAFRACLRSWTTALTRIHEMMQLRIPLRLNLSR